MRSVFRSLAALSAMMAMASAPFSAGASAKQSSNKEMAVKSDQVAAPVSYRNVFGGFGNASTKPSRFLNQRQYRKMVRQNPWIAKSRKHRKNN